MQSITRFAPLTLLVLAVGCMGYEATPKEVLLPVGGTQTVHIVGRYYNFPFGIVTSPAKVFSSDNRVATVDSDSTSPYATIQAINPGTAYLVTEYREFKVVTINVFACPQVSLTPATEHIAGRVGAPVRLQVTWKGYQELSLEWFEERPSGWSQIPFAWGPIYEFTPRASGIYRFQARSKDVCGEATATVTVAVPARTRAVAH